MSDMPQIHGGAFAGISQALKSGPKSPSKPEGEHKDADYSHAHDASKSAAGGDASNTTDI
jgi:hypothetical protein